MSRIIYINGNFIAEKDAFIPLMDRSFLFGDGIYEVSAVINGKLVDNEAHLVRLNRSLNEIEIPNPYSNDDWVKNQQELIARNSLKEGIVYTQVSRGAFEREFTSPIDLQPTIVMFTQEKNILEMPLAKTGAKVITVPDQRWERRDIKSVSLLAQVLAKRAAQKAGAHEAWMIEDDFITEGASSTAFIITKSQEIITRPLSNAVLPGITRKSVIRLAAEQGLKVVERPFTVAEVLSAAEAFYTSASSFVMPVISIDGQTVGAGQIGALSLRLREIYLQMAQKL
jgi:D-alanine transaminase